MVGFNKYTLDEQKQRELAQIGSAQVFKNFSRAFHKISLIATIVRESFQKPGNNPVLHFTQGRHGNHNHLYQSSPPLPSSSSSSSFPSPSFFTCVCVNICARVCMWRKEVLIRCSYQSLLFFSWDNISHWTLISLDWLSTMSQGSPCLLTQLSTHRTEVIDLCHSHIWFFFEVWLLRIELRSSCLHHRPFIDWDFPPASRTPTSWQVQFQ